MGESDERVDEAVDDWQERAGHGGDSGGSDRAAEEHRRYDEVTKGTSRRGDDGAVGLGDEQQRHDTPPGTEQTAG